MRKIQSGDKVIFTSIPDLSAFSDASNYERFRRHYSRCEGNLSATATQIHASQRMITFVISSRLKNGSKASAVINVVRDRISDSIDLISL